MPCQVSWQFVATKSQTPVHVCGVESFAAGGAFGSIMGRNAFQRPRADAIKLLQTVIQIFKDAA